MLDQKYEIQFTKSFNKNLVEDLYPIRNLNALLQDYTQRNLIYITALNNENIHLAGSLVTLLEDLLSLLTKEKLLNKRIMTIINDNHSTNNWYMRHNTDDECYIEFTLMRSDPPEDLNYLKETDENYNFEKFEKIFQETADHKVKILKVANYPHYIIITNKMSWNLYFKALILFLEKERNCEKENQLYKLVTNILKSLLMRSKKQYEKYIEELIELTKIWDIDKLKNLFRFDIENEKRRIKDLRVDKLRVVQEYTDFIARTYKEIEALNIKYDNLTDPDEEEINDTINYIQNNPYLKIISKNVVHDQITFVVNAPLLYYDEDYLDTMLSNFDYDTDTYEYLIFQKVFKEKKYRFWTYAEINLNVSNFTTRVMEGNSEHNENYYMPHPHLQEYGCQGNHPAEIQKWIANHDYIGCFEQIISMAMNMNFLDSIVTENMIKRFYESETYKSYKTFEDVETGEFYNLYDLEEKES